MLQKLWHIHLLTPQQSTPLYIILTPKHLVLLEKHFATSNTRTMKTQVVLAILAFLSLSTVQSQESHYCGRHLSETLVKYCDVGTMDKRSDSWMRSQLFGTGISSTFAFLIFF